MINTLWYGDNLRILRDEIDDESVDLIYLDPPFNSNRNYNVLFKEKSGEASPAQIQAFTDTWEWNRAASEAMTELKLHAPDKVSKLVEAMESFVGHNDMMAYLVMMTQRLVELHRVLKPTGSIYLHCDPTASHYLKMIMDAIFGVRQFRNEIVWKRAHAHNSAKRWGPIHDVLLFYTKSDKYTWTSPRQPYEQSYIDRYFKYDDNDGRGPYWTGDITGSGTRQGETGKVWRGRDPNTKQRHWAYPIDELERLDADNRVYWGKDGDGWPKLKRYLAEAKGVPLQDVILDVGSLSRMSSASAERLGYPTQKPLALLERIIEASSNPGDVVLDPFCGCGPAVVAAQKLGRKWIGMDITHLAVALMKNRLLDQFGEDLEFQIKGIPTTVNAARELAKQDRYAFQDWANLLVNAEPRRPDVDGKSMKGADGGVDGVIRFMDDQAENVKRAVVSVKSGKVGVKDIKDLRITRENEKAEIALFVTLEPPTKPMITEALLDGLYDSVWMGRSYPRVQILTIEELLDGVEPEMPPMRGTFQKAKRIRKASEHHPVGLPGLE